MDHRKHLSARLVAVIPLATLLVPAHVAAAADAVAVTRVNVAWDGGQSKGAAQRPAMSSDGRTVIFDSAAPDLVSSYGGSTSGPYGGPAAQLYARDGSAGRTEAVSISNAGAPAVCGVQGQHDLDADGSTVVFASKSLNLTTSDTACYTRVSNQYGSYQVPNQTEIYVRNRETGTTEKVSVASGGSTADGQSDSPVVSDDGRHVAFVSYASNLVPNDTNNSPDVFVRDLTTRTTKVISADTGTGTPRGGVGPAISADGNWVAFASSSRQLDPSAPETYQNLFLHDLRNGTTTYLALPTVDGAPVTRASQRPSLSADGTKIAFESDAGNLVDGDTIGPDLFVHDRTTRTTTMVNRNAAGVRTVNTNGLEIADSGTAVLFAGDGQLIGDERTDVTHLYVRDLSTGRLQIASLNAAGVEAIAAAGPRALSADARLATFASWSSELVDGDTNGVADVFVRDLTVTPTAPPGTISERLDGSGSTASSGLTATAEVPVQTAVVAPAGPTGDLTATPRKTLSTAPTGYSLFGWEVVLEGPVATAEKPYTVTFTVDSTVLNGIAPADVQVFRDAVPLTGCTAPEAAVPDPCIVSRGPTGGDGDAAVTVRTSHFSTWSVGRLAYDLSGPLAPVDSSPTVNTAKAGSAIPVKFTLGGDKGSKVLSTDYPKVVASNCSGSQDEIEQTVTAGASGLTYDASSATYTYTWKTARTPGCRDLILRMRDGSELRAKFNLR